MRRSPNLGFAKSTPFQTETLLGIIVIFGWISFLTSKTAAIVHVNRQIFSTSHIRFPMLRLRGEKASTFVLNSWWETPSVSNGMPRTELPAGFA